MKPTLPTLAVLALAAAPSAQVPYDRVLHAVDVSPSPQTKEHVLLAAVWATTAFPSTASLDLDAEVVARRDGVELAVETAVLQVEGGSPVVLIELAISEEPKPDVAEAPIEVFLRPAPGALPELDPSNDPLALSNIGASGDDAPYWDRAVTYLTIAPSSTLPGGQWEIESFFDIDVEVDWAVPQGVGAMNCPLDLSCTVVVEASDDQHVNWIVLDSVAMSVDVSTTQHEMLHVLGVQLEPGALVRATLVPTPGALPELHGFGDDEEQVEVPGLFTDTTSLSLHGGGVANFWLVAGPAFAGDPYFLLGSMSGTAPGLLVDGHVLPLNVDAFFLYTLANPNQPPYANTLSVLDAAGQGAASLTIPAGSSPNLAGTVVNHAYAILDGGTFDVIGTSNAAPLQLLP